MLIKKFTTKAHVHNELNSHVFTNVWANTQMCDTMVRHIWTSNKKESMPPFLKSLNRWEVGFVLLALSLESDRNRGVPDTT